MFTFRMNRKQGERLVESLTRYASLLDAGADAMKDKAEAQKLQRMSAQALIDAQSVNMMMEGSPVDARCIECHETSTVIMDEEGDIEIVPHVCKSICTVDCIGQNEGISCAPCPDKPKK